MTVATRKSQKQQLVLCVTAILCMLQAQAFRVAASISARRSLSTLRGVNGDKSNSDNKDQKDQKIPQTGWIHNLPSENSPFWQSADAQSAGSTREQSSSSSTTPRLRTGWLHNTAPAATQKQKQLASPDAAISSRKLSIARQRLTLAMTQQTRNHQIHSISFPASGSISTSLVVTEHSIMVPLNRQNPADKRKIRLYFSMVEKMDDTKRWRDFAQSSLTQTPQQRAQRYIQQASLTDANNMVLYLQGGPGFGAPAPVSGLGLSTEGSWAGAALQHYERVVLMDQRGTGQSSPITKQSMQLAFPDLFLLDDETQALDQVPDSDAKKSVQTAADQVTDYLSHFRADNIVLDAEDIRDALMMPPNLDDEQDAVESDDAAPKPWGACLGQSFGGFCSMTYLSLVEHPPQVMLLTGGIAPQLTPCYDVYCSLWDRVRERSLQYYDMYPSDVAIVKTIVRSLLTNPVELPSGGRLTARRFLQLGLGLGGTPSAFASLHQMISTALLDDTDGQGECAFRRSFLKQIEIQQSFDDAPLYFWLHESIYGDGPGSRTNWAAHRAYIHKCQESSDFDYTLTCQEGDERPVLFFGEMVFPWMSEDYGELRGAGLAAVAEQLAQKSDWSPLYNADRMRTALDGKVRAAAAVYYDDMYVDFNACAQVTRRGGPLEKCKVWISNEYQHSGLRDDGAKIFTKLLGMAKGNIRTPS